MAQKKSRALIFSPAELSALCLQLGDLLHAGISPEESFSILAEDAQREQERALFTALSEALAAGQPLSKALSDQGAFPDYMLGMLGIAECTGTMEEVCTALAAHFDREDKLEESIRSAVAFPLLMGAVMAALLIVMAVVVLPVFDGVFASMGLMLSPIASGLMHAGKWLVAVAAVVLVAGLGACAAVAAARKRGKLQGTRLFRENGAVRFASAMALMLHSGLELEEALRRAGSLTGTPAAVQSADAAAEKLALGATLSDALVDTGLFSGFHLRMLRVGERAGCIERTMDEVAARMAGAAETKVDERISRIEPAVIMALAAAAGLILLSIMLPLLGVLATV